MDYRINRSSEDVRGGIFALPDILAARYIVLTRRMEALGPNLGEPHTKALGQGLFELRHKGAEGVARVFYRTVIGKRIVMLHGVIKKTAKTPRGLAPGRSEDAGGQTCNVMINLSMRSCAAPACVPRWNASNAKRANHSTHCSRPVMKPTSRRRRLPR